MSDTLNLSRRTLIKGAMTAGAAGVALPWLWRPSQAAQTLVCADPGGAYTTAFKEAFYEPFTKETGIAVTSVARRGYPAAEFKAQVETKSYNWDLSGGISADIADFLKKSDLVEDLDLGGDDVAAIPANMKTPFFVGNGLYTFILAYRSDRMKNVKSFASLWDKELPGGRGMRRFARDSIEVALRADGVAPGDDIYKVLSTAEGWDRAFKKLDEIKPQVQVWWDSAPQSTQIIQTGEVDICPMPNARAQTAIDNGVPVAIDWEGGFYSVEGWCIPKGAPKADLARQFVKFCARADRQAAYTKELSNGPTNPGAYKFIDEKRAPALPSFPDNLAKTVAVNDAFWGEHKAKADVRFSEWLLS
ncbi:dehydrogenase [Agaricicola taiwanensis]|uniref:Dehydrogenase n=1 Tax=Agaricicola taiwanensis TaxID=591372 RepID=A0A8J2YF62_9RHOB|nr:ABC transporter substrate-binding protein [Agaricicola taiwanensis]GGE28031.1 dehydrogenase [Agaricicola taiwanensis]